MFHAAMRGVAMRVFSQLVNTLRQRQNGRDFPDDIFKWIFVNENAWISINISLKLVSRGPISDIPALVQIMAWRRPGDKTLSEPMLVSLLMHICITRPQWVKPLTLWPLGYVIVILVQSPNWCYRLTSCSLVARLFLGEYHRRPLMMSQHLFK